MKKKSFLLLPFLLFAMAITGCHSTGGNDDVPVTGISLTETSLQLTVDETHNLVAEVQPSNATNKTVTWSSSDSAVASVSSAGSVKALKAGSAEISAKAGKFTAKCQVTVKDKAAAPTLTEITVSGNKAEYTVGEQLQITVTAHYSDSSTKVLSANEYTVSGFDSSAPAENQVVTVTHQSVSATFSVIIVSARVEIPFGEEYSWNPATSQSDIPGTVLTNPDNWYYWNDQDWCGSVVTMGDHYMENGKLHFSYTATATKGCDFGFRVFYRDTSLVAGSRYKVSIKVQAQNDAEVKISAGGGNVGVFELTGGVEKTLTSDPFVESAEHANFNFVVPVSNGSANSFVLSDLAFELQPVVHEYAGLINGETAIEFADDSDNKPKGALAQLKADVTVKAGDHLTFTCDNVAIKPGANFAGNNAMFDAEKDYLEVHNDATTQLYLKVYSDGYDVWLGGYQEEVVEHEYSIVGSFAKYDWAAWGGHDTDLVKNDGKTEATYEGLMLAENDNFKIREDKAWTTTYGFSAIKSMDPEGAFIAGEEDNIKVVTSGIYTVKFIIAESKIVLTKTGELPVDPQPVEHDYSLVGQFSQYDWAAWGNHDTDLVKNDGKTEAVYEGLKLDAGDAFKVREDKAWTTTYGFSAIKTMDPEGAFVAGEENNIDVVTPGIYTVTFIIAESKITLVKTGELPEPEVVGIEASYAGYVYVGQAADPAKFTIKKVFDNGTKVELSQVEYGQFKIYGHESCAAQSEIPLNYEFDADDVGDVTVYIKFGELVTTLTLHVAEAPTNVAITFSVTYETVEGQAIYVIGDFCDWKLAGAFALEWHEGHVWSGSHEFEVGTTINFKFIMVEDGEIKDWEADPNRTLLITEPTTVNGTWQA